MTLLAGQAVGSDMGRNEMRWRHMAAGEDGGEGWPPCSAGPKEITHGWMGSAIWQMGAGGRDLHHGGLGP